MSLTWKDAATTLLAIGVILLTLSAAYNWHIPVISNYRVAALLIIVAGITMCVLAGLTTTEPPGVYAIIMASIGGFILLAGLFGLIFDKAAFVLMAGIAAAAMWFVATVRHVMSW